MPMEMNTVTAYLEKNVQTQFELDKASWLNFHWACTGYMHHY